MQFSKKSEGNWEETIQVLDLIIDIKLKVCLLYFSTLKCIMEKLGIWMLEFEFWILK